MEKMKYGAAAFAVTALALGAFATTAYACESTCGDWDLGGDDNSVYIKVSNDGYISNTTSAKADTGDNKAKGSYGGDAGYGGDGGDGGEAEVGDEEEGCGCEWDLGGSAGEAVGGDGGNGGHSNGGEGGQGGTISTGEARSEAGTINMMNTTVIRVVR